jgi:hypothetical protein
MGSFYIVEDERKFHPVFNGELLGSYDSAELATAALAGGLTARIAGVQDISSLAISADLKDWSKLGYKLQNIRDLLSPATRANIMNRYPSVPAQREEDSDRTPPRLKN